MESNAHFQNAVAERRIRTLQDQTWPCWSMHSTGGPRLLMPISGLKPSGWPMRFTTQHLQCDEWITSLPLSCLQVLKSLQIWILLTFWMSCVCPWQQDANRQEIAQMGGQIAHGNLPGHVNATCTQCGFGSSSQDRSCKVQDGTIFIHPVSTTDMLADIPTKVCNEEINTRLRQQLMGW